MDGMIIYPQIINQKNLDFQLLPGLKPLGVPKGLKGTTIPFRFNNWDDLKNIIRKI